MDLSRAPIAVWLFVAVVGLAVFAFIRHRPRRKGKPGGLQMMGALMLGFGEPFDPPSKHVAEAKSDTPKEGDESGDPPKT